MMCVVCVGLEGVGWLVNKGTHPGDVCCVCRMGVVVSEQRDSSR